MDAKICGITNLEDARAAAAAGAAYVGLIRAESPRQVPLDTAREIVTALPATTTPVLVFRDAAVPEVLAAVAATGATWVQLHGQESPRYIAALQEAYAAQRPRGPALRIVKAWEVEAVADADVSATMGGLRAYVDELGRLADAPAHRNLDAVLLDAPKGRVHPGFDVLGAASQAAAALGCTVWCAGGLTAENLAGVLPKLACSVVDVASGVEAAPGRKDHAAVARFVAVARQG